VIDVHRLAEFGVLVALAALEQDDVGRVGPGGVVELGEAEGGDRAAKARSADEDVDPLGQ
jgi:hypothetical protein